MVLRHTGGTRVVGWPVAERVTSSALASQALDRRLATRDDLEDIADGWRRWAKQHDGWFTVLDGEVLCRG